MKQYAELLAAAVGSLTMQAFYAGLLPRIQSRSQAHVLSTNHGEAQRNKRLQNGLIDSGRLHDPSETLIGLEACDLCEETA